MENQDDMKWRHVQTKNYPRWNLWSYNVTTVDYREVVRVNMTQTWLYTRCRDHTNRVPCKRGTIYCNNELLYLSWTFYFSQQVQFWHRSIYGILFQSTQYLSTVQMEARMNSCVNYQNLPMLGKIKCIFLLI